MPHYNVVGALVVREGKVLAARRGASKYAYVAHKYEFAGGKVEPGESEEEALARELREELGVPSRVLGHFCTVEHAYPDFTVRLSISCAQKRLDGHRRALAEAKIPFREQNVLRIGTDGSSGREMVMMAAARKLPYTAIFCFNDMMAYASMLQLSEYGVRVPEDISVIGYDHVESHYFVPIGLTTIDTDKEGMADLAVRKMVAMLEGKEEPRAALAPPRLNVGKTVRKIN